MGLFDFIKNKGQRLFSNQAHASEKIEEHLKANNPGIKDLKVSMKDTTAFLSGEAQSAEALQKAVLLAGNVEGVESVNVNGMKIPTHLSSPQAVESFEGTQYYVIQSGDTLSKISERFYGSAGRYTEIFEANREVIRNPNLIYPGQKIRIPHAKAA